MAPKTIALSNQGRVTAPSDAVTESEREVFTSAYQKTFAQAVRSGKTYAEAVEMARDEATAELRYLMSSFYTH